MLSINNDLTMIKQVGWYKELTTKTTSIIWSNKQWWWWWWWWWWIYLAITQWILNYRLPIFQRHAAVAVRPHAALCALWPGSRISGEPMRCHGYFVIKMVNISSSTLVLHMHMFRLYTYLQLTLRNHRISKNGEMKSHTGVCRRLHRPFFFLLGSMPSCSTNTDI